LERENPDTQSSGKAFGFLHGIFLIMTHSILKELQVTTQTIKEDKMLHCSLVTNHLLAIVKQ